MNNTIKFSKMQASGNDFVIINAIEKPIQLNKKQCQHISHRHFGVGCDQILILSKTHKKDSDFYCQIYNADGSQVGQCGNGMRCLGLFMQQNQLASSPMIRIDTISAMINITQQGQSTKVALAIPTFSQHNIVDPNKEYTFIQNSKDLTTSLKNAQLVELGNRHLVLWQQQKDLAIDQDWGQAMVDKYDANIGLAYRINDHTIYLRVYERGAGETLACGSGAAAAVAEGIRLNYLKQKTQVQTTGGLIDVEWPSMNEFISISGPVAQVFNGSIEI